MTHYLKLSVPECFIIITEVVQYAAACVASLTQNPFPDISWSNLSAGTFLIVNNSQQERSTCSSYEPCGSIPGLFHSGLSHDATRWTGLTSARVAHACTDSNNGPRLSRGAIADFTQFHTLIPHYAKKNCYQIHRFALPVVQCIELAAIKQKIKHMPSENLIIMILLCSSTDHVRPVLALRESLIPARSIRRRVTEFWISYFNRIGPEKFIDGELQRFWSRVSMTEEWDIERICQIRETEVFLMLEMPFYTRYICSVDEIH